MRFIEHRGLNSRLGISSARSDASRCVGETLFQVVVAEDLLGLATYERDRCAGRSAPSNPVGHGGSTAETKGEPARFGEPSGTWLGPGHDGIDPSPEFGVAETCRRGLVDDAEKSRGWGAGGARHPNAFGFSGPGVALKDECEYPSSRGGEAQSGDPSCGSKAHVEVRGC